MKILPTMPEATMLAEIGERIQRYRVGINLTQVELAKQAGVSPRTIERLEAGNSVQFENLLRVLRAMRLSYNLDQLIPEASIRPLQLAGSKAEIRHRANARRSGNVAKGTGWVWGDRK